MSTLPATITVRHPAMDYTKSGSVGIDKVLVGDVVVACARVRSCLPRQRRERRDR